LQELTDAVTPAASKRGIKCRRLKSIIQRQGGLGGTYRRRSDDAFRALNAMDVGRLPPEVAFIFYFLACEKIAKVMIGIARGKPGRGPAFSKMKWQYSDLISAAKRIGCSNHVSDDDIKAIFVREQVNRFSANAIRNRLLHDFGPTHVIEARMHAPRLIKAMQRFFECRTRIISILDGQPEAAKV
jgi:hypothetical protein